MIQKHSIRDRSREKEFLFHSKPPIVVAALPQSPSMLTISPLGESGANYHIHHSDGVKGKGEKRQCPWVRGGEHK